MATACVFTFCGRNPKIIMRWPRHVKTANQPGLNGKLSGWARKFVGTAATGAFRPLRRACLRAGQPALATVRVWCRNHDTRPAQSGRAGPGVLLVASWSVPAARAVPAYEPR